MKILIYGDIGDYGWLGDYTDTGSLDIVRALDEFEMGDNVLELRINSLGGQVNHGVTILNYVRQFSTKQKALNPEFKVRTIVDGLAYSSASIVALAADEGELIMNPGSMMMIHRAWMHSAGNAMELRQTADYLEKTDGELAKLYATRTGKTAEEMEGMMDAETFFSADEAIALGLADKANEEDNDDIETALAKFQDAPRKKSDTPKGSYANFLMARHTKRDSNNSDDSGCAPSLSWLEFAELDRQIDALSAI